MRKQTRSKPNKPLNFKKYLQSLEIEEVTKRFSKAKKLDLPVWPLCALCQDEYNPKRLALGYKTCLSCGTPKKQYCSVTMHKSNSVLVTNKADLKFMGSKTPRE